MWAVLVAGALGVLLSLHSLAYYSTRAHLFRISQLPAFLCVLVAWSSTFLALASLPLDLRYAPAHDLEQLWHGLYIVSFVLTWFVIPVQQRYYESGYLSTRRRIVDALWANFVFYCVAVVGLLILWLATPASLYSSLIALANTWGTILYILLLGYGFIEYPRFIYRIGSSKRSLDQSYTALSRAHSEYHEIIIDLVTLYTHAAFVSNRVQTSATSSPLTFGRYADAILSHFPMDLPDFRSQLDQNEFDTLRDHQEYEDLTEKKLADLNRQVKQAMGRMRIYEHRKKRVHLAIDKLEARHYEPSLSERLFDGLSLLCAMLSAILLWCQVTLFANINLSPFAWLIRVTSYSNPLIDPANLYLEKVWLV